MSSTDWEEVKRLAADFQRVQLSSGAQRLSERNCIEIINRLTACKLLDVVFTTDGKEYVTPAHLLKEIKDELIVSGGRINFVELANNLSIDLSVISKKASEFISTDHSVKLINGQLIDNNYIYHLCSEINEKLANCGQVTVEDLTSDYELPGDFLLHTIEKNLGKLIKGIQDKQDRQVFFTNEFVQRNKAIVSGALAAITKPISTAVLINQCNLNERLFLSVVDALMESKSLPGVFSGKQKLSGTYVPYIYTKGQQEWVSSFYRQNGYLELKGISRLGISDPVSFATKQFPDEKLVVLKSVIIGSVFLNRIEGAVDEAVTSGSYLKLWEILPSNFDDLDLAALIEFLKKKINENGLLVFGGSTLVSDLYLKEILKSFEEGIENAAKRYVTSGEYLNKLLEKNLQKNVIEDKEIKVDKKEERRKKAAEGKTGGGTQGRETKTKSTKKKYLKSNKHQDLSDNEEAERKNVQKLEIIAVEEIIKELRNLEILQEDGEEEQALAEDLAIYLDPILNKKCLELARVFYESTISSVNQSRKKKLNLLQEKLGDLLLNVRLFDRGLKLFDSADQVQLVKYLLKSTCTEIVNEIFLFIAQEQNQKSFENLVELTAEQRLKVLAELPADIKDSLFKVHKSLTGSSIEEFLSASESALGPNGSDIMIVKHDKKREKPQILNIKQQLIEQLNSSEDPAVVLHLALLIIFQNVTQNVLFASGKFVSIILSFLKCHLPPDVFDSLKIFHELVLKYLSQENEKEVLLGELKEQMVKIKEIALTKKPLSSK